MPDFASYNSKAYDPLEDQYAQQEGIPVEMLRAIRISGEQSNANAVSPAGARSVFQFTPPTRQSFIDKYNIDPWSGPDAATHAAAIHLGNDWKRSGGDVDETVLSYIAGPSGQRRGPASQAYLARVKNGMRSLGYGADGMAVNRNTPAQPSKGSIVANSTDDDTDGTDGTDDSGTLAVPGLGSNLSVQNRNAGLAAAMQQQSQSLADIYGNAAKELTARYQGPSRNDMLLALGSALLQPTRTGSFGEALANVGPAMQGFAQQRRQESNALEDKLLEMKMAQAKELSTLQGRYITAAYKQPQGIVFDQTHGVIVDKNNPGPTENWVQLPNKGPRLVQWQDDTWHGPPDAQGMSTVYKRVGEDYHPIRTVKEPY